MGKYLILLAVVLLVVWWLRSGTRRRSQDGAPTSTTQRPGRGPQAIVACAQCGLHLPAHEALPGRGGVFCGEPHRAQYEREHPAA